MSLKNKAICVTGGAGFIGSHIAENLCDANYVRIIDNLSTGSVNNIQSFKDKIEFIKGDVTKKEVVKQAVKDADIVFHEAATDLLTSLRNPMWDLRTNILGTFNILEAIKGTEIRLIFASTGSVYGEPLYQQQDENHPLTPTSLYGVSKLAAEKYCMAFYHLYDTKICALRLYNVYGPRSRGVIPIFVKRVLNDEPPLIEGDGEQRRCFTHVNDVVHANILAATNKNAIGEAFNVATNEETTINELANRIIHCIGKNLKPIYVSPRLGDVKYFNPDISKAKKILGYSPKITLEKGLKNYISWAQANKDLWHF